MIETELSKDIAISLLSWLEYQNPYQDLLVAHRDAFAQIAHLPRPNNYHYRLDPSQRLLCEMPLCGVMPIVTPPQGFKCIGRYVLVCGTKTPHYFMWNEALNLVVCLTIGQFAEKIGVPARLLTYPGSRMEEIRKFDLGKEIVFVDDPISKNTVLIATPEAIVDEFGIDFFYKPFEISYS